VAQDSDPKTELGQQAPAEPEQTPARDNASEPTLSFKPILSERFLRRRDGMSARPRANARVALVVVRASGELYTYLPGRRPTAGEMFWGSSGTMYEVDMGRHETSLEIILPSIGDASAFHATADVKWRVKKPDQIVKDGVTDVRATLRPPMQQRLGDITQKYDARAVKDAEEHARNRSTRKTSVWSTDWRRRSFFGSGWTSRSRKSTRAWRSKPAARNCGFCRSSTPRSY